MAHARPYHSECAHGAASSLVIVARAWRGIHDTTLGLLQAWLRSTALHRGAGYELPNAERRARHEVANPGAGILRSEM